MGGLSISYRPMYPASCPLRSSMGGQSVSALAHLTSTASDQSASLLLTMNLSMTPGSCPSHSSTVLSTNPYQSPMYQADPSRWALVSPADQSTTYPESCLSHSSTVSPADPSMPYQSKMYSTMPVCAQA